MSEREHDAELYSAADRAGVASASTPYLTTQQVRPVADLIIAKKKSAAGKSDTALARA